MDVFSKHYYAKKSADIYHPSLTNYSWAKMTKIQTISTDRAAPAQGHYSQAVVHEKTVYVAMQIAIDPVRGPQAGSPAEQAKVALENVKNILVAAGSSLEKVLRVTVYISDIAYWSEINSVYSEIFGTHKPARGVVPVGKLHLGLDVGFEVTATLD